MDLLNRAEQIPNNKKQTHCHGTYLFHLHSGGRVRRQQQYFATEAGVPSVKRNHRGLEFEDVTIPKGNW